VEVREAALRPGAVRARHARRRDRRGQLLAGAIPGRGPLSGVAPRAYIGNYKVLTVPTANFGLNGNAPEIAAGVEAAVKDGMDVVNLSLGEPEIEPSRDLVVAAINAAADAGRRSGDRRRERLRRVRFRQRLVAGEAPRRRSQSRR
jgi:hypothetical protein